MKSSTLKIRMIRRAIKRLKVSHRRDDIMSTRLLLNKLKELTK